MGSSSARKDEKMARQHGKVVWLVKESGTGVTSKIGLRHCTSQDSYTHILCLAKVILSLPNSNCLLNQGPLTIWTSHSGDISLNMESAGPQSN